VSVAVVDINVGVDILNDDEEREVRVGTAGPDSSNDVGGGKPGSGLCGVPGLIGDVVKLIDARDGTGGGTS
jgi:hypothetical protein